MDYTHWGGEGYCVLSSSSLFSSGSLLIELGSLVLWTSGPGLLSQVATTLQSPLENLQMRLVRVAAPQASKKRTEESELRPWDS